MPHRNVRPGRCSTPRSNDLARSGAIVPAGLILRNTRSGNCDATLALARTVKPRIVRSPSSHGEAAVQDPADAFDNRSPLTKPVDAVRRESCAHPLTTLFDERKLS